MPPSIIRRGGDLGLLCRSSSCSPAVPFLEKPRRCASWSPPLAFYTMLLVPKSWNFLPSSFLSISRACNSLFPRLHHCGKAKGLQVRGPHFTQAGTVYAGDASAWNMLRDTTWWRWSWQWNGQREKQSQGTKGSDELVCVLLPVVCKTRLTLGLLSFWTNKWVWLNFLYLRELYLETLFLAAPSCIDIPLSVTVYHFLYIGKFIIFFLIELQKVGFFFLF